MYNCELFLSKKHRSDYAEFDLAYDEISVRLYENSINIKDKTDVGNTSRALTAALTSAMKKEDAAEWYIVANILDTSDASSFKDSFYDFVAAQENRLNAELKRHTSAPKIKIFSLGDLGNGYKGYCFRIRDKKFLALPAASLCGMMPGDLIIEGVRTAEEVFNENASQYPDGYSMMKKSEISRHSEPKKKENFFMSFIPHKGDTPGRIARKIAVLVALAAFLGAGIYVLLYFVVWPYQQTQTAAEIQTIAYRQNSTDETTPEGDPLPEQDWDALKKVNKEIVGWIRMDNTPIDYPVLEHKGDDQYEQYYLKHTYKKEYSDYGSIFVDYRCKQSVNSKNVILHGHNMLNGSMFHELVNYGDLKGNLEYYKKHPVLTFNTPDGDSKWKVISVFKTSTLYAHGEFFNYMQGEFNSEAEFMNFVYNVRVRSLFNIPVVCNEDDDILTLSTCSYEFTGFRTVLVARRVRPGEDPNVDVQLATLNPNPLFPDVYYQSRGGTRPDVSTFKTANAKGQVSWYDGKGNLKGSETLTATVAANPTEPPTEKGSRATQPAEITFYTIRFMNYDGTEFDSVTVKEGDPLTIPDGIPAGPDDESFIYVFREWDTSVLDVNNVTTGADLYPQFDAIPRN